MIRMIVSIPVLAVMTVVWVSYCVVKALFQKRWMVYMRTRTLPHVQCFAPVSSHSFKWVANFKAARLESKGQITLVDKIHFTQLGN